MGYIIKVDHAALKRTAKTLSTTSSNLRNRTTYLSSLAEQLGSSWSGEDYQMFASRASSLSAGDSTLISTCNMLDSFAEWAEKTAEMYISAQSEAINKANGLL